MREAATFISFISGRIALGMMQKCLNLWKRKDSEWAGIEGVFRFSRDNVDRK